MTLRPFDARGLRPRLGGGDARSRRLRVAVGDRRRAREGTRVGQDRALGDVATGARARPRGRGRRRRSSATSRRVAISTYAPPGIFDLGIGLFRERRGRGIGTTAIPLITAFLFDEERADRVQLSTDVDNVAMRRAAEKAGFALEGVMRGFWSVPDAADARLRAVRADPRRPRRVALLNRIDRRAENDGSMWTRGTIASVGEILRAQAYLHTAARFGRPGRHRTTAGGMFIWPLLLFVGGLFLVILFIVPGLRLQAAAPGRVRADGDPAAPHLQRGGPVRAARLPVRAVPQGRRTWRSRTSCTARGRRSTSSRSTTGTTTSRPTRREARAAPYHRFDCAHRCRCRPIARACTIDRENLFSRLADAL